MGIQYKTIWRVHIKYNMLVMTLFGKTWIYHQDYINSRSKRYQSILNHYLNPVQGVNRCEIK